MGLPELLVIAALIALLFAAHALPPFGRRIGEHARIRLRLAKWIWNSLAGSDAESVRAEQDYGQELARTVAEEFPGNVLAAKQGRIQAIGSKLAGAVRDRRTFSFRTIATCHANAFALPGGFVFVTESLLDLCRTDDHQIAFILGHEMGHILHGHARDRLMIDMVLKAVTARAAPAGQMLVKMALKAYSRDQEREADREAIRLAKAAGFDPRGAVRAL